MNPGDRNRDAEHLHALAAFLPRFKAPGFEFGRIGFCRHLTGCSGPISFDPRGKIHLKPSGFSTTALELCMVPIVRFKGVYLFRLSNGQHFQRSRVTKAIGIHTAGI